MTKELTGYRDEAERFRHGDRIREARDYARVRRTGKRQQGTLVSLELVPAMSRSRLGLVVSKRVGNAVVRNRVKRAVREWFRRNRQHFVSEWDLVVIARSEAASASTRELWSRLDAVIARVSI